MIEVITEKPVAIDSPDHLHPWGTMRDNSRNPRFIEKLRALWGDDQDRAVLDLGCSGGGFVHDCLDAGWLAVGIEGSDYSKKNGRAEWPIIPGNLFTADITEPFSVTVHGLFARFDLITAWEVIEHIRDVDLPAVCENVRGKLEKDGLWILSVNPMEQIIDGFVIHQNVHDRDWWHNRFEGLGWKNDVEVLNHFGTDFVRCGDNAPGSFHFALRNQQYEN